MFETTPISVELKAFDRDQHLFISIQIISLNFLIYSKLNPKNLFQELTKEVENHRVNIDSQNKNFYEMKKKKDTLQNERK